MNARKKKGQSEGATYVILNLFGVTLKKVRKIKLMLVIYLIQQIQILPWQHGINTKIVSELFYIFLILGPESNEYLILIAHLQVLRSHMWQVATALKRFMGCRSHKGSQGRPLEGPCSEITTLM